MIDMSNENMDIEDLFVDRESVAREISKLGKGVLRIDRNDCTPIIPLPLNNLSNSERILLELATIYLCFLSGLRNSDILSRDELEKRCRFKKDVLRARLSDLRKSGLIQSMDQGESITVRGLLEFLDLLTDIQESQDDD